MAVLKLLYQYGNNECVHLPNLKGFQLQQTFSSSCSSQYSDLQTDEGFKKGSHAHIINVSQLLPPLCDDTILPLLFARNPAEHNQMHIRQFISLSNNLHIP